MSKDTQFAISLDPLQPLKAFTPARIALGRVGMSLPTRAGLEFQLAHALARDAVSIPLDFAELRARLQRQGYSTLAIESQAETHQAYLQRPDLGRVLNAAAIATLLETGPDSTDAVIVVADGLSSKAIEHHAEPFIRLLSPALASKGYTRSPIILVNHGRVAIGDAVAERYAARLCIVLIGERPGLSSPDSMGIYFTYRAKSGISSDADRNCISNIHHNGLSYEQALTKLLFLVEKAEELHYSGVNLKDDTSNSADKSLHLETNFLLG